ncbi:MAG: prolyl oligopeptidase family serine peptidase [Planctomycetaceae bacterium]|jgi:prolyl oligopeptidase|nr:prolyl oligopeptidase family serine peptidase [Planctomycetaceae bacterium]
MKMNSNILFFVIMLPVVIFVTIIALFAQAAETYPTAKQSDQTDTYFGVKINDPYRWMETNDTKELSEWIEAENKLSRKYLDGVVLRDDLKKRLTEVINYPRYSIPSIENDKTFYFKNDGLQNQSVLYVLDTPESAPRVLIDPNKFSADGTVSLGSISVSKNAEYIAYSISKSGSDWKEIKVRKIATGEDLPDKIEWVKFSGIAWQGDGFYYSCYDAPPEGEFLTAKNENHKIFFHKLNSQQKNDTLIREDKKHPLRTRQAATDFDEKFLFIQESESTYGNTLAFKDLTATNSNATLRTIVDDFNSEQSIVTVIDGKFYMLTDRDAPRKRFVVVDPLKPLPADWVDIIPESESLLSSVNHIGGKFIVTFMKDASDVVFVYDLQGKRIREINLPTFGKAGFSGKKDSPVFFQSFTSFVYPTVIYRANIDTGESEPLFPAAIDINPDNYITERVWYTNSAGKKVPIFLTYKKGLKKDGNNPTLLYGYGGFNISLSPSFSALRLPFLDRGGVYAIAILRGGGEYGEEWHKAGTKLQKQNVFDDFISSAEFLVKSRYTSPSKLAILGGSNGGLLVAAVAIQRPDLFKAAVPRVGVLDMLRYHKFTIGWAWATDYGTSEDSKEMFDYLLKYSPLHNIKSNVNYPAMLIMTSDHDDRVVPAHSFKFAATLQQKSNSKNPIYIRIETKAGHGAGKPISKQIEEEADVWSFILDQLEK